MSAIKSRDGSIMIGALVIALVIASLASLYVRTAFQELRFSHETRMGFQALNLAEGGVEHAVHAFLQNNWSGWTQNSSGNYHRIFSFGDDRYVRVIAFRNGGASRIFAEGVVENPLGNDITRQVLVDLDRRGLFANGMTAREGIVFSGNRVQIDSYSSSAGPYDPIHNRRDGGSVASINVDNEAISVNNADIWGFVATGGGEPRVGPNGSILGEESPHNVKIDYDRVSYDFYADFPEVQAPSTSGALTFYLGHSIGVPGMNLTYRLSSLNVNNNQKLTIYGNVNLVVDGKVDVKGELNLANGASLSLFLHDDMSVGGNGVVNESQVPANLRIFAVGNNVSEIKLHGNGALHGVIYAPNSEVNLRGGGHSGAAFGAIVAESIRVNGNYSFHYDEDLAELFADPAYKVDTWAELYSSDLRLDYDELVAKGFK